MGRPPICTCGTVALWGKVGPTQSQMLADWYSPSHIVHGFLFYAALAWLWPRAPIERRFIAALLIEAAWEIAENTPMIIDRYREATDGARLFGRFHPQFGERHRNDGVRFPVRPAAARLGQRRHCRAA